jgi:hypothetical protein
MKENINDTSLYATFFEKQLSEFQRYISSMKDQSEVVRQLNLIFKIGRQTHNSKYNESPSKIIEREPMIKGKFFKKGKLTITP